MKKFKVIWYDGCLSEEPTKENDFIKEILEEKIVKAMKIDNVRCLSILPEEEMKRYHHYKGGYGYVRGLLCDDENRMYDYGSYTKFVWVQEVKDENKTRKN